MVNAHVFFILMWRWIFFGVQEEHFVGDIIGGTNSLIRVKCLVKGEDPKVEK